MHRILILVTVFLIAIVGMLFLQGDNVRNPAQLAAANGEVAVSAVSQLSAPATQIQPSGTSVGANALAAAVAVSQPDAALPAAADDPSMANLTAGVLADLGVGPGIAMPPATTADDPMASMTANVLASLGGGIASAPGTTAPAGRAADLQGLVTQALRQGQSDAYIDMLLNEAATSGRVAVPRALMTADGRVDTRTLLASIVRQAQVETDAYTNALVAEATAAAPALAAPPRPATVSRNGGQFYIVEPGDSLAYIAMMFYGTPASYTRIFEANRAQIASPDMIRVGQKLLIPG